MNSETKRLTTAQALVNFLRNQYVERDGKETAFFAGVWGIFGHGNVAGVGQALQQNLHFRYYLARNEQAMVHAATAFAKMSNRLRAFACTSSVGPGATNMITGAATATINRLPVLLLPGDIFARRNVAPVLQQLESPNSQDISVNDAFKPVSRYWDRINRPDQLPSALMEAMRVLTSPAETGAVVLALPEDVQAEAWDYPAKLFEKRLWHIARPMADRSLLAEAIKLISAAKAPLIIAGGGVIYGEANAALASFVEQTGIRIAETQAGKGSLAHDHPQNLGAIGVTGTPGANASAREADLVIALGTRLSDFTTASKTAFQNPEVRFININIAEVDAYKHAALPLVADVRVVLEELSAGLGNYRVPEDYRARTARLNEDWATEVARLVHSQADSRITQCEVIDIVNSFCGRKDVVVCAAGSLPGDLHKLWRTSDPKGYHLEYGYSCMGYEIAGGLGVKMADPSRNVYVMVGDGSYLMMSSEIVTSIQEGHKLIIVVLDNHGFGSIGGLSKEIGSDGFGTSYRHRRRDSGLLNGEPLAVDFCANAASLGALTMRAWTREDLQHALEYARKQGKTTVIVVEVEKGSGAPGYETWWDVPVAEVSESESVKQARVRWEEAVKRERYFL
ncbi:MAG: 3D-(3,5/4)-trihydroxycyclohexane-1,2-dione acylhydrolase (decyclizing) [Acidobacteria bacterium]|nr:MAG: 3D-(3,5/4)-trihydroxycyclohexane-1,2-dione acylhydrolase (decyclizing) [Acidobacteriota bacterium]